jgi:CheY-like chemotaxis protein
LAIADYLRDCGYTVYEAGNVADAQSVFLAALPVDVVFSDVQMPGDLDGFGLARWLRGRYPDVPVVLTSGVARLVADAADLCDQADFVENRTITPPSNSEFDRCFRGV